MKKLLSLLMVIALLPLSASATQEGRMLGVFKISEDISETAYIRDVLYFDGAVYATANNNIYVLHENDKAFRLYAKPDKEDNKYITHLLTDGEKLYAFYANEGLLCAVESSNGNLTVKDEVEFDMSNHIRALEGEFEEEYVDYPQAIHMLKGKLCALYSVDGMSQSVLSVFDVKTGEEEIYDDISNIMGMCVYKEDKLLITTVDYNSEEGPIISTFDLNTGEMEEIGPVINGEDNSNFYGSVAYNPFEDYILFIEDGNVFKHNDEGEPERVAYFPSRFSFFGSGSEIAFLPENRMAHIIDGDVHITSLNPEDLPEGTLNILGLMLSNSHEKAIKKLPDVSVNVIDFFGDMGKELSERLVSGGGSDIDIMVASSSETDIKNIINKGYAMDMSDIPGVKEFYDSLYPYYKEVNPDDGKIYALPVWTQFNNYSCNPDLFKKLGMEIPETFDELCDCMVWWNENPDITEEYNFYDWSQTKLAAWNMLFSVYRSFIRMSGQELKYDTPEFRSMVEKLTKSLENVEEIQEPETDEELMEFYERSTLLGQQQVDLNFISNYNEMNRVKDKASDSFKENYMFEETYPFYPLVLKVKDDLPSGIGVNAAYLMISSQGKNTEQAKAYVKAIVELLDAKTKAQFSEDFDELVENPYYNRQLESIKDAIANTEKELKDAEGAEKTHLEEILSGLEVSYQATLEGEGKYEYTREDLNEFKSFLKDVYLEDYSNNIDYGEETLYLLRQRLIDGQIDVEAFIKEMDAKLNLIRMENQ